MEDGILLKTTTIIPSSLVAGLNTKAVGSAPALSINDNTKTIIKPNVTNMASTMTKTLNVDPQKEVSSAIDVEKKVIWPRTVHIRRITAKRGLVISVASQVIWQKIVRAIFAEDKIGTSRIIVGIIGVDMR